MSEAPVAPGEILSNRFRVERVLGVGGMGVVVEATHLQLQQRIALKFLLPHMVANAEAVQRFLREARAAATIRSEHVARVSDVGTLDDGAPYMVMEYLDGTDLGQRLRAVGKLEPTEATEIILQTLEAISEAHAAHIVHRDLKPGNLFMARRRDGSMLVKVLDFGISKPLDDQSLELTRTSAIMGSPLYMSPEQLRASRNADQRSDIWSIGVIMYELVSGDTPFGGESLGGLALAIGAEPHRPLKEIRPDVPQAYSDAIERCLAKSPANRFQSVAELAQALRPLATSRSAMVSIERITSTMGEASPASVRVPDTERGAPMLAQTNAGWGQTKGGADTRLPNWLIATVTVLPIALGVLVFAFAGRESPDEAAQAGSPVPSTAVPVVAPAQREPVVAAPAPVAPVVSPATAASSAAPAASSAVAPVAQAPHVAPTPAPAVAAPRPVSRPAPTAAKKAGSGFSGWTRE